ncbi:MAG: hypothetical protein WCH10_00420 [bacterium]
MTHTITFDTFQQAQRLKEAGFTENQVKAQIENSKEQTTAINELINDNLATKQDIKELELATKRDIKELELATKHDINELAIATKRDIKELAVATKRDIKELAVANKHDIKELELKLESKITSMGYKTTIATGIMISASVGILSYLIKLP